MASSSASQTALCAWPARAALLFLVWASWGCGGGAQAPEPLSPNEGRPIAALEIDSEHHERLRASVELLGIELGVLETRQCPGVGDQPARVVTEMTPSRLVRAMTRSSGQASTELAAPLHRPQSSDYSFREGDILRHYEVDYGPGGYRYVYDNGGEAKRRGRIPVPDGAYPHDMHSAVALLRSWRPRLGERGHFFAVLGRRLWRVDLRALGPEVIKVGGSHRLSQRIDGRAVRLWKADLEHVERTFSVWLSDDPSRTPLHLAADTALGPVTVTLTESSRGFGPCRLAASNRLVRGEVAPR